MKPESTNSLSKTDVKEKIMKRHVSKKWNMKLKEAGNSTAGVNGENVQLANDQWRKVAQASEEEMAMKLMAGNGML